MQSSSLLVGLCLLTSLFAQSLPEVDLGYETHRALQYDDVDETYLFKNVRYAQAPIGDLRFAAPVPPSGRETEVQTGATPKLCPQGVPGWNLVQSQWLPWYVAGNASLFNFTQAEINAQAIVTARGGVVANNTLASEDCLFLDVMVDRDVFENAANVTSGESPGAPVLLWIHGGGYVFGYKDSAGTGAGLLRAARSDGRRLIFVPINYRLGAFGFSSGPSFQEAGGVANAGLYDQRRAIEWVAENIHLFGGDKNQITILGESAGGGSVVHQLAAFGGHNPAPIKRAIAQSPGYHAVPSFSTQEGIWESFLSYLNVSTLEEARAASSEAVITANEAQVAASGYSTYTYNPVVDGIFAPNLPGRAFAIGAYNKNVTVLASHNTREGAYFTIPTIKTDDDLGAWLKTLFHTITDETLADLYANVYPATYDGSLPYTNGLDRAVLVSAEYIFHSNKNFLARAYGGGDNYYSYMFQVEPGLHGADVLYTFYDGADGRNTTPLADNVALTFQSYLANFVTSGDPNGNGGVPFFPAHGTNGSMNALNVTGTTVVTDPTDNERTRWWGKALYV